ncbi:MAG: bifunctional sulfate adenylyltransferase/adenylylsulfate kinase [Betaproteobacteria bacterium]|nr:bifunctional sulfate adenylyltransferase/adenylylsulfate kinase [Betaproteobacteria bacterium]
MDPLIAPYGGSLVDRMADAAHLDALKREAVRFPVVDLNARQLCDLELLLNGGYSPLQGFMGRADYEEVLAHACLSDGQFWPLPVVLDVSAALGSRLHVGDHLALRDPEGLMVAVLQVEELWQPDLAREARLVFGSGEKGRARTQAFLEEQGSWYIGGRVTGTSLDGHHDYTALRLSPSEMRARFARAGWRRVIAFQPDRPMHRAHVEFTLSAALARDAHLLIHAASEDASGDRAAYFALIRTLQAVEARYPAATTLLAVAPLHARGAGLREVWARAIVSRNYGCSQLIVGEMPDEASEAAQTREWAGRAQAALGVELIAFPPMVYVEDRAQHMPAAQVPSGTRTLTLSQEELSRRLSDGLNIPDWFSYPEVVELLQQAHPPRHRQGFTLFFTGLSGAGKSTLARVLTTRLLQLGGRSVTLLDGDVVRKHLSSELGFSKEHRNLNVRRIGFVAAEITKNRGVAICAPIAPYASVRRAVREMVEAHGGFVEIHVCTPLEVCETRDRKGLYAKARQGLLKEFTGVSDPYEVPETPELALDTSVLGVEEAVARILLKLEQLGYLR